MVKISLIKTFWSYLKHHLKSFLLFALFSIIFSIIFSLYDLYIESIFYSALLCFCIGVVFVAVDFIRYYNRHKLLTQLQLKAILSIDEIPVPNNLIEQDYSELIQVIHNEKIRIISQLDNSKSEMVDYYTMWAHQIKTPIAAMQLMLQSQHSEDNNVLSTELFKIEQYVEMVLSYLRLDSNSTDFVFKKYSLDSIVKQAVRKYASLFIRKKISLDLDRLDYLVLTDEKWLLFVIEQVLSNALKYTNKGKISISVQATDECQTLIIEDTGIGITDEDLPRICDKGFTGYNGRTDKKATGIGLYLCKRILTKLSHTIRIQSKVGKGTTVMIGLNSSIK